MSGNIYQFGLVTLPGVTARWNLAAKAQNTLQKVIGGYYDTAGADDAPPDLSTPISVNAQAYESTKSALGAALDELRGLVHTRNRLWLDPWDVTQTNRFCMARCIGINLQAAYNNVITQPVELLFQPLTIWQGHSYGGSWDLDAGYLFDSGLWFDGTDATALTGADDIALVNAGNARTTNVGIALTAGDAAITAVTFTVADLAQFSWAGTLVAGNTMYFDCGARRVTGGAGGSAYSGFALGANHYSPYWLPLAPGTTTVNVATTGGGTGATVQFTYADGWV